MQIEQKSEHILYSRSLYSSFAPLAPYIAVLREKVIQKF